MGGVNTLLGGGTSASSIPAGYKVANDASGNPILVQE
jgi:hypothetical protein